MALSWASGRGRSVIAAAIITVVWSSDHRDSSDRDEKPRALIASATRLSEAPGLRLRITPLHAGQKAEIKDYDLARLASAAKLIRKGKPADALSLLAPPSPLFPDRRALLKGQAFQAMSQWPEAQKAFQQAVDLGQTPQVKTRAARGLINVFAKLGEREGQLYYFDALLADSETPRRASLELQRAVVLQHAGRTGEAARAAYALLDADPERSIARRTIQLIERLHQADPSDAHTTPTSVRFLTLRNRIRRASHHEAQALVASFSTPPNDANPRGGHSPARKEVSSDTSATLRAFSVLLSVEVRTRRRQEAKDALASIKAIDLDALPAFEAERTLARRVELELQVGAKPAALRAARAQIRALLDRAPDSPFIAQSALMLGDTAFRARAYDEAKHAYRMYVEHQSPSAASLEILWKSGFAAFLDFDFEQAKTAFEEVEVAASDPALRHRATYWVGRVHEELGEREAAIDRFAQVLDAEALSYMGLLAEGRLRRLTPSTGDRWARPTLAMSQADGQRQRQRQRQPQRQRRPQQPSPLGGQLASGPGPSEPKAPPSTPSPDHSWADLFGLERPLGLDRAMALADRGRWRDAYNNLGIAVRFLSEGDVAPAHPARDLLSSFSGRDHGFALAKKNSPGRSEAWIRALLRGEPAPWLYLYPRPYARVIERESQRRSVDPFLVYAIVRSESRFGAAAESEKGAQGLMQLLPSTAKWLAQRSTPRVSRASRTAPASRGNSETDDDLDLTHPETNLRLGIQYLARLLDRYEGNAVLALVAYNAGPGIADRWLDRAQGVDLDAFIELIAFSETERYVKRSLGSYRRYACLYGQSLPTLPVELPAPATLTVARGNQ
ncbi:MAG: transglycosylase SLT domain-containing protein [Deltaproteobacteria bacterium]|nr:transglycosylase SLT domain-containing protein [Deltaproteobacteria bacterium]